MKDGRCPMCNGTEVYAADRPTMAVGGDYLYLDLGDGTDEELDLTAYVCANCGYTALFVDETVSDQLPLLKKAKGWHKV